MSQYNRETFTPDRLFCPGPTPIPPEVTRASQCQIYHRSEEFAQVFKHCAQSLKPLFGCETQPIILTSSGTGAMEAVMVSLTAPGDSVVVVNGGKFGERWEKLATAYQCQVSVLTVPWGEAPKPHDVVKRANSQTKAVLIQANETSTGAYYPVSEIAHALRNSGYQGLIMVDAISSLGAHEMKMDLWKIDAVVAGSQKGFGLPPGLAFVALSPQALAMPSNRPRFYFDLFKEYKGQSEGRSAWTPAISLIYGLKESLAQMEKVGFQNIVLHHEKLAKGTRAAVSALGLELFAKNAPSQALTSIKVPQGIDGVQLLKRLRRRFGMFVAGGQDELKGKIIRFSHLGFINQFDILDGLAALEFALLEEGYSFEVGCGVKAAMSLWTSR
jgi:aspartate aminotransferase-like enzyme